MNRYIKVVLYVLTDSEIKFTIDNGEMQCYITKTMDEGKMHLYRQLGCNINVLVMCLPGVIYKYVLDNPNVLSIYDRIIYTKISVSLHKDNSVIIPTSMADDICHIEVQRINIIDSDGNPLNVDEICFIVNTINGPMLVGILPPTLVPINDMDGVCRLILSYLECEGYTKISKMRYDYSFNPPKLSEVMSAILNMAISDIGPFVSELDHTKLT